MNYPNSTGRINAILSLLIFLTAMPGHLTVATPYLSNSVRSTSESLIKTIASPSTTLPLNDINIVILTDVHSWVAGHGSHDPFLNAGYGDVLSFYQHLQAVFDLEENEGKDLFFVMNGDFLHGTGLSADPPTMLIPILEKMPWDAVNIGNHELLYKSTIEYISKPNGFINYWEGTYLTSNVRLTETGESLGSRYTFLRGSANTILTFGFLYDMTNEDPSSIVDSVEEVVQEPWFVDVLEGKQGSFDAIVVLAHMDFDSPHAHIIIDTIRSICGENMAVQIISGHSHLRATEQFDNNAVAVEAGRFMDTVGFVSFSRGGEFQHEFIDANMAALASTLNLAEEELSTDDGSDLSKLIYETQYEAGLLDLVACAPENYFLNRSLDSSNSLWGLYMKDVVPNYLFGKNSSKIMIQERHDFWYNLYSGNVTVTDVVSICALDHQFYQVAKRMLGSELRDLIFSLQEEDKLTPHYDPMYLSLTQGYYLSGVGGVNELVADEYYDVYTVDNHVPKIKASIETNFPEKDFQPEESFASSSSIQLWMDFMTAEWVCTTNTSTDVLEKLQDSNAQSKSSRHANFSRLSNLDIFAVLSFVAGFVLTKVIRKRAQNKSRNESILKKSNSTQYDSMKPLLANSA